VTVTDMAALERWIAAAREQGHVAVDTETDSLDPMGAELVGISLAVEPGLGLLHPAQAPGSGRPRLQRRCPGRSCRATRFSPR
jgi:DNA polymerase I